MYAMLFQIYPPVGGVANCTNTVWEQPGTIPSPAESKVDTSKYRLSSM
jgi:hypothetical protein